VDNEDEAKAILNEVFENVSFVVEKKTFSDMSSELRYPQAQHVRIRRKIMEIALHTFVLTFYFHSKQAPMFFSL
jgi:hypothetical protein